MKIIIWKRAEVHFANENEQNGVAQGRKVLSDKLKLGNYSFNLADAFISREISKHLDEKTFFFEVKLLK